MTRHLLLQKWRTYALEGLLPIWLLDLYVLSRYPMFELTPQLLPLAVVCVAVLEGAYAGTGFGLGVGLLWTLTYPGTMSMRILLLALVGMAVGVLTQYALQQSFPGYLLCSFGVMVLINGLNVLQQRMVYRADLSMLARVACGDCLLTLMWSPVVYVLFQKIFRRVGGTKLA